MFIRGEANNASIELSEREGLARTDGSEYYRITLREHEFEATTRVYAFDPRDEGLAKYLAALADDWKGWHGHRTWASLEGEFELDCEHDGLGHILTIATIHPNRSRHGWTAQIRFDLVAGQLDEIASGVKQFFEYTA